MIHSLFLVSKISQFDCVHNSIQISLILLVVEAGIDIDMSVMKLVGTRGLMIAVVGSLLPIGVGVLIAWAINVGDWKAILASGSVFGPTSLGIALNVLKGGKICCHIFHHITNLSILLFRIASFSIFI